MTTNSPSAARGLALVSGAGSGIGRELARMLAERGHPVALLGRRLEPLEETLALCGGRGGCQVADVRDATATAAAVAAAEARWGAVEVLVPAAGVAHLGTLDELTAERFAAVVDTNLKGTFHLIRAALPAMKARGCGRIVPVLSVAARRAFPTWGAYCASKWGLDGLIAALREELSGSGVGVTALFPGATDTPLWNDQPGTWDRTRMVPAGELARALAFALDAPSGALVEEIQIGPAGGAL